MKIPSRVRRAFSFRRSALLRVLVAGFVVASLGLEIMPGVVVERVVAAPGEQEGRALRFEPLQVCGHGDSFFGVLFDLPVLPPGGPGFFPPPEAGRPLPEGAVTLPSDFRPAIDRPPRLSA